MCFRLTNNKAVFKFCEEQQLNMTPLEKEISLQTYLEGKMEAMQNTFSARMNAMEKATTVAAGLMDKRLEAMNEFRNTLKDQASQFLTQAEFDAQHQRVLEDIRMLRESKATLDGKASQQSVNISLIIAVVGMIMGMINVAVVILHVFK